MRMFLDDMLPIIYGQSNMTIFPPLYLLSSYTYDLYRITHLRLGLTGITGHNTALIASSNTVFKPFCVKAEHSRYFTALISFAMANPFTKLLFLDYIES